jgi:hypothetical protein
MPVILSQQCQGKYYNVLVGPPDMYCTQLRSDIIARTVSAGKSSRCHHWQNSRIIDELTEAAYLKACVSSLSIPRNTAERPMFMCAYISLLDSQSTLRLFFRACDRMKWLWKISLGLSILPARHTVGLSSSFSRIVSCQELLFLGLHVHSRKLRTSCSWTTAAAMRDIARLSTG